MNDIELLKPAAQSAGLSGQLFWSNIYDTYFWVDKYGSDTEYRADAVWNPLKDDGDALRLAAQVEMDIYFHNGFCLAHSLGGQAREYFGVKLDGTKIEKLEAARRAIVRVAAKAYDQPAR